MSKAPPVPEDQKDAHGGSSSTSKHPETNQDAAGANADINLREQGRYGGLRQNITPASNRIGERDARRT